MRGESPAQLVERAVPGDVRRQAQQRLMKRRRGAAVTCSLGVAHISSWRRDHPRAGTCRCQVTPLRQMPTCRHSEPAPWPPGRSRPSLQVTASRRVAGGITLDATRGGDRAPSFRVNTSATEYRAMLDDLDAIVWEADPRTVQLSFV